MLTRRLLVVAADRAFTKFVAEALLDRAISAPPQNDDAWDISRAHAAIEAKLLVSKGGRPFDVFVIDNTLPDEDPVALIAALRQYPDGADVPLFLMTERGRDPHSRRTAAEQFSVAGFIEKPVTADGLREALERLERKRRVLIASKDQEEAAAHESALKAADYVVETVSSGRAALERAPRFKPDLVTAAIELEDMRGMELCVEMKKSRLSATPVLLHGPVALLGNEEISENAHRADDFMEAPFEHALFIERIATLIGRGAPNRPARPLSSQVRDPMRSTLAIEKPPAVPRRTQEMNRKTVADGPPTHTPPTSASPAPVGRTKRSTRRVPCSISMSVRNGEQVYKSKTLDISHGGIFLSTGQDLSIGTLIDMTFQIPGNERSIRAIGKVAWVGGPTRPGVGVKFSKISTKDLQLIVDYVNRVSKVVYSAS